jgi:aspartate racemase
MKTIGILGGMSWESTALYYKWINEGIRMRLGGLHSASLLLDSCDFAEMERLQAGGKWLAIGKILSEKALKLENAGAGGLLIATNSMHEVADEIERSINVPLLHIADSVGRAVSSEGITKVGLLGTKFTMERSFYTGRLKDKFGIAILVPETKGRDEVHRIIYQELCRGIVRGSSKKACIEIMSDLEERGAQAIVMGCTEIGLLVDQGDTVIPLYDTARLHADTAVAWMLE